MRVHLRESSGNVDSVDSTEAESAAAESAAAVSMAESRGSCSASSAHEKLRTGFLCVIMSYVAIRECVDIPVRWVLISLGVACSWGMLYAWSMYVAHVGETSP